MGDSWKQWGWDVQRHQTVHSEQSLKSVKTVTAFKACRSSSTQRNGIAILYQSVCPSPSYTASLDWHSLGVRKTVGNQAPLWWWSENDGCLWHMFGELSFMLLDTEQKSSTAGDCDLGENENVRWMSWQLFMPYENVLSSRLVTHLLFWIPTQKEINSGSSSGQVYLIQGRYIYLIIPKEKYHLGALQMLRSISLNCILQQRRFSNHSLNHFMRISSFVTLCSGKDFEGTVEEEGSQLLTSDLQTFFSGKIFPSSRRRCVITTALKET